jgi:hypothetical protein
MKIIFETLLGLFALFAVVCAIGWFLFREQFYRAIRYFKIWSDQDKTREDQERRVKEALQEEQRQILMREASAREKAEAEIEETL